LSGQPKCRGYGGEGLGDRAGDGVAAQRFGGNNHLDRTGAGAAMLIVDEEPGNPQAGERAPQGQRGFSVPVGQGTVRGDGTGSRRQAVDGLFQVAGARGRDLQRVGGIVARQHNSIAIRNDAAIGHGGHEGDAIILSARLEMLVLDNL